MSVQHEARRAVGKHRFTYYEIAVNQYVSDPYRQRVGISVICSVRHACRVEDDHVRSLQRLSLWVSWANALISMVVAVLAVSA